MSKDLIYAADLFCGAGGGSNGFVSACEELGLEFDLAAVNHWKVAIQTHSSNHPNVRHFCENLDGVSPVDIVPNGKLHFALFAPECTHHSKARGGKPKKEQSRATAWCVVRWAELLDIDNILVENVEEFLDWGPLYPDDHPDEKLRGKAIPSKKGVYYRDWIQSLKRRGYKCEHRILNAAWYGAATSRKRYFLQAKKVRDGKRSPKITWPEATHESAENLFGKPKYRGAREIIDWTLQGNSIYNRKKPLAPNTMRRIYAGLAKYSGLPFIVPQFSSQGPRSVEVPLGTLTTQSRGVGLCEPFLVVLRNNVDHSDLDGPVPTLCTARHMYLAEPFVIPVTHSGDENRTHDLGKPLPTITTAKGGELALVDPFIVKYHGSHAGRADGDNRVCSIDEPIKTLDTQPRFGLAEPVIVTPLDPAYLVSFKGNDDAASLEVPLGTITTRDRFGLCEAFVLGQQSCAAPRSVDEPLPTIATAGAISVIEPFIVPNFGESESQGPRTHSLESPLPTITSRGAGNLVAPFIVPYYGNSSATSIDEPLDTVTTKDRFALIQPEFLEAAGIDKGQVVGVLDIRFRMLQTHELGAAMGFPADYQFSGNKEAQVKQIGNAIEFNVVRALCREMLKDLAPKTTKRRSK